MIEVEVIELLDRVLGVGGRGRGGLGRVRGGEHGREGEGAGEGEDGLHLGGRWWVVL